MKHTSSRSTSKNQMRKNPSSFEMSDQTMTDIDREMMADEMPESNETVEALGIEGQDDQQPRAEQTGLGESSKSISSMIGESLAKETQATIDESLAKLTTAYKDAKKYAGESPAEAVLLACSVGMGAWALLGTKPGRKVLDMAAARFVPELTAWASKTFKASIV